MGRKRIVWLGTIIFILGMSNIGTVLYFQSTVDYQDKQLGEAYQTINFQTDQIEEYDIIKECYNQLLIDYQELIDKKELLTMERDGLLETYRTLSVQLQAIKKNREELRTQMEELNTKVEEYDYVFQYDPVELEECQTYISELENRLMEYGEYDIYEIPSRSCSYGSFQIYLEDGASEKWADQAMEYLSLLPEKMLNELKNAGWLVIITPRNLESVYDSGVPNTVGLTIYYKSRIYIINDSFSIKYCTIHEVGHAMDFLNDFISYDKEWLKIYNEEAASSGLSEYFTKSSTEYFAESFQSFFLHSEELREASPKTYEYMKHFYESYR